MARTRFESRARARALQALYAWEIRGQPEMSAVAFALWSDVGLTPEVRQFADRLVQYVAAHVRDIDASLVDVTTNWRLERLGAIERAVLRLASAELALGDAPPRVVLQEAIYLAERFGTERSARFVNGVLDAVARRMGRL